MTAILFWTPAQVLFVIITLALVFPPLMSVGEWFDYRLGDAWEAWKERKKK
jgi:hypothetical protein